MKVEPIPKTMIFCGPRIYTRGISSTIATNHSPLLPGLA